MDRLTKLCWVKGKKLQLAGLKESRSVITWKPRVKVGQVVSHNGFLPPMDAAQAVMLAGVRGRHADCSALMLEPQSAVGFATWSSDCLMPEMDATMVVSLILTTGGLTGQQLTACKVCNSIIDYECQCVRCWKFGVNGTGSRRRSMRSQTTR